MNLMRHITVVSTACFLIASPVLSQVGVAGSQRQIVIVPVYDQPSKDLDRLRDRLESQLMQQKNLAVIPAERVRGFFFQGADTATPISKTTGDNVFLEAREYFYNGKH